MATLLDRAAGPGRPPAPGSGGHAAAVGAGVRAAVQAAAASFVVVLVPAVLGWAAGSSDHARWAAAVRVAVDAWLLAHHSGIAVAGGNVGLVPLGSALVPLVACWLAGVRLARGLDPRAEALRAGSGRGRPAFPGAGALVAFAVTYAGIATLAAGAAVTEAARPLAAQALLGSLVVAVVGALPGAAAWEAGGRRAGVRALAARVPLPGPVQPVRPVLARCLGHAGLAVAALLGGALVAVLVALALRWDRALLLHRALEPGLAGGLVLVVAQLCLLPNLVVWAASVLTGPGFALGVATSVTPGETGLGPVPAVPLLAALPPQGVHDPWWWLLLGVPVAAGAVAGLRIARPDGADERRLLHRLGDAAVTGLLAGLALTVLGWLSGGPAGPGRMSQTGPDPLWLGLAGGAEVLAGAVAAVVVTAAAGWARTTLSGGSRR